MTGTEWLKFTVQLTVLLAYQYRLVHQQYYCVLVQYTTVNIALKMSETVRNSLLLTDPQCNIGLLLMFLLLPVQEYCIYQDCHLFNVPKLDTPMPQHTFQVKIPLRSALMFLPAILCTRPCHYQHWNADFCYDNYLFLGQFCPYKNLDRQCYLFLSLWLAVALKTGIILNDKIGLIFPGQVGVGNDKTN